MELDKKQLRKKLIQMRLAFDENQKQSHFIIEKLKRDSHFRQSKKIGIYLSYRNEVDTWKLIQEFKEQKEFYVPIVRGQEMYFTKYQELMQKNKYGILEPVEKIEIDKNQLDLMLVPLVGYNQDNYRLGYGGGYYDRYLKNYHGYTIGLAYTFQYLKDYQPESFDVPLNQIITDEKI
ncbi:MAG: 5-formyltetrahydrofolate cyclo-ligase [Bacillota bacterium]|nr:5-formyltetrahydrofolate cyclo-ligase [Bacillota bacterium]